MIRNVFVLPLISQGFFYQAVGGGQPHGMPGWLVRWDQSRWPGKGRRADSRGISCHLLLFFLTVLFFFFFRELDNLRGHLPLCGRDHSWGATWMFSFPQPLKVRRLQKLKSREHLLALPDKAISLGTQSPAASGHSLLSMSDLLSPGSPDAQCTHPSWLPLAKDMERDSHRWMERNYVSVNT